MEDTIDEILMLLNDKKPITIRKCIQALGEIVSAKPGLNDKIASSLISFNIYSVKEIMRKSLLLDMLNVLFVIRKERIITEIEGFITNALSEEILNIKSKKQVEAVLAGS